MQQRWKATWMEAGRQRVVIFESLANRKVARIDFRLQALARGIRPPEHFELDECEQCQEQTLRSRERKRSPPRHT